MLSARACNAQHASAAARRAGMRRSVERELTCLSRSELRLRALRRPFEKPNAGLAMSRGRRRFQARKYARISDAQLMLSVVVAARRRFIGSTTTLAPT